jgi:hypothetical protein
VLTGIPRPSSPPLVGVIDLTEAAQRPRGVPAPAREESNPPGLGACLSTESSFTVGIIFTLYVYIYVRDIEF